MPDLEKNMIEALSLYLDAETLSAQSVTPSLPEGAVVHYRGYMLSLDQYGDLHRSITVLGATMLTRPDQYAPCHYNPNWYSLIEEYTPETVFFQDIDAAITGIEQPGRVLYQRLCEIPENFARLSDSRP